MRFFSDNAASVHPRYRKHCRPPTPATPPMTAMCSPRGSTRRSPTLSEPNVRIHRGHRDRRQWPRARGAAPPHGGIVCHREAHIEVDEGGAPGFYTHGAKLILAEGDGAKLTPEGIAALIDPIRDDVHQVQPHALSLTQGQRVRARLQRRRNGRTVGLREDPQARAARRWCALRQCRGKPRLRAARCLPATAALSFGCVKNGGMNAEGLVLFEPGLGDLVRYRRKRAGHLQSKGRFLAAQLLAMLDGDLWLANARAANAAARRLPLPVATACSTRSRSTSRSYRSPRPRRRRCARRASISMTGLRPPEYPVRRDW